MGSSGGGKQTSVNVTQPWGPAQDLAKENIGNVGTYMDQVMNLVNSGYNPFSYGGDRVAGFSPNQRNAMDSIFSKGMNTQTMDPVMNTLMGPSFLGGGALDASMNNANQAWNQVYDPTLSGDMLSPDKNPYLKAYGEAAVAPIMDNFMNQISPSLRTTAQQAGRMGSGAASDVYTNALGQTQKQMGDTLASIYAPAYQQERNLQMGAAQDTVNMFTGQQQNILNSVAPYIQGNEQIFKMLGHALGVGEQEQQLSQAEISADQDKFRENLYGPLDWMANIGNVLFTGGQQTTGTQRTKGFTPSLANQILGGGMGAAGLYSMFSDLF